MMRLETEPRFVAKPAPSYDVFAHRGGVLLLPGMYGTELAALGPAYWSETGAQFVPASIDGSEVALGPAPELRPLLTGTVNPQGFAFFRSYGHHAVKLWVGPTVRVTPSGFAPPQESVRINDLIVDDKGQWWLSGFAGGDEAKGRVYTSNDGAAWTLAVQQKHWALARIFARGDRLIGLQYKQFNEVTAEGVVKIGSAKAHMDDAVFTASSIVAFGEGMISVLSDGAKKTRYAACPVSRPVSMLAVDDGLLVGGLEGLFYARDVQRIEWEKLASINVRALVESQSSLLAVTHEGAVHAIER